MSPQPIPVTTARRWTTVARTAAVAVALAVAAVLVEPAAAGAVELRFSTENDLLADNPTHDDLYSYAAALEIEREGNTYSLRENGFTDRASGIRFDETYLTVGRSFGRRSWTVYAETGVVHVGHGLLGESAQNAVHRLIGGEEVDLRYSESSLHGHFALTADRLGGFGSSGGLELGPRVELDAVPGLHSHAVVAAQARWQPTSKIAVHLVAGERWSHASRVELERHVEELAPVARLGVVLAERLFFAWSYNDYGDEREHFSIGVRLGAGGGKAGAAD